MKIFTLKRLCAFIIMTLFSSPALHAQQVNDFFNKRFHKKIPHSMIKNDVYNVQNNSIQKRKNPACIEWQTTIGGSGDEDRGAIKTIPGGYITCGSTTSTDGDFHLPANHDVDAYVVKLDNKGHIIWTQTYGGSSYEDFNDILPTSDGGFIAIGSATSDDGDVTGHHGDEDVWVVKCNSEGKIQWQHCYGGIMEDHGNFIVETNSGYAFCAGSASADGDLKHLLTHGLLDAWIVKISFSGKILFQQTYGGSDDEDANGIYFNTADKTILFATSTSSNNGDVNGNHGGVDAWVAKINAQGNIIWKKTLGGSGEEEIGNLVKTTDGNIVFAGYSNSFDGDVAGNKGLYVAWLVKLNAVTGTVLWDKTFANPAELGARGIFATADGGTVSMGLFGSSTDFETWDAMVMKLNAYGNQEWIKIFGGSKADYSEFGTVAANGNIITSNYTESNDGDVKKADGGSDIWIVTLDNCGTIISNKNQERRVNREELISALSAYPNPFKSSTTISFSLSQAQKVSLKIYDENGRLVKIMADQYFETGMHKIEWNTDAILSVGMFFLKMQTTTVSEIQKLMISK